MIAEHLTYTDTKQCLSNIINSARAMQLSTTHTVELRWGASLNADCGYNSGGCLSHSTVSEMT